MVGSLESFPDGGPDVGHFAIGDAPAVREAHREARQAVCFGLAPGCPREEKLARIRPKVTSDIALGRSPPDRWDQKADQQFWDDQEKLPARQKTLRWSPSMAARRRSTLRWTRPAKLRERNARPSGSGRRRKKSWRNSARKGDGKGKEHAWDAGQGQQGPQVLHFPQPRAQELGLPSESVKVLGGRVACRHVVHSRVACLLLPFLSCALQHDSRPGALSMTAAWRELPAQLGQVHPLLRVRRPAQDLPPPILRQGGRSWESIRALGQGPRARRERDGGELRPGTRPRLPGNRSYERDQGQGLGGRLRWCTLRLPLQHLFEAEMEASAGHGGTGAVQGAFYGLPTNDAGSKRRRTRALLWQSTP